MPKSLPALLTPAEAAGQLGCDEKTVRTMCEAGLIPGAARIGSRWAIPAGALRGVVPRKRGRQPKPR